MGRGQLFVGAVAVGVLGSWIGRFLLGRRMGSSRLVNALPRPNEVPPERNPQGNRAAADWFAIHPEQLAPYPDEWVAVVGRDVVAHDPSMIEVVRLARERGYDDPLLIPVTPPETTLA